MVSAARRVEAHICRPKIGADTLAIGDHRDLSLEALAEEMSVSVVNIDDSAAFFFLLRGKAFEKLALGLEVLLHRLVIIEMILREICEDGGVEFDRARAMLHERMAGDFHGHGLVSCIEHLGENS